jgi:hypothetical protein
MPPMPAMQHGTHDFAIPPIRGIAAALSGARSGITDNRLEELGS